jgi:hypothetical protein
MRHGCRWGLTAAIRALAARPAPFQPGQIGSSGDVRQIPVSFATEEPSAGQARTGNGRADMRRRLTGLARMAIPARSRPGRGRSRAAARQCRGGGSLAMLVPRDRQVPGPASHPARTQSRASAGTRCAHQRRRPGHRARGGHAARGLIRPEKTGRSLVPSPAHSLPGMLTHA